MARNTKERKVKARMDAAPLLDGAVSDDARRLAGLSLDADFLRMVIEESNRCFFLIEPQANALVYISPAFDRIWGRPREEFYRDPDLWYATIHPDDVERCRKAAELRLAEPSASHPPFEYRIYRPDGSLHWVRGNVFRCQHADRNETLLCGVAEDITD